MSPLPRDVRTLVTGAPAAHDGPVNVTRIVVRVAAAALGVLILVGALGVVVVQRMAEQEALNDASQLTDLPAKSVIMPALEDSLLDGDQGALQRFDTVVRQRVLADDMFIRVRIWSPEGVVLLGDEPNLIGQQFTLGEDQRRVLSAPATVAEVSNLTGAENEFERAPHLPPAPGPRGARDSAAARPRRVHRRTAADRRRPARRRRPGAGRRLAARRRSAGLRDRSLGAAAGDRSWSRAVRCVVAAHGFSSTSTRRTLTAPAWRLPWRILQHRCAVVGPRSR